jgi:class 3 adenylate cyclase/CheY-like chemotaxis protein
MANGVILCIDDERMVLDGLQSQLGRDFGAKYSIELAESGEEALELISELLDRGKDIPIVISDQLMPGIKGNELLKLIHKVTPGTYTVLLTGQSDLDAVIEAVNYANLYRYITKPWEGNDLILTVREAIKGFYQDKQLEEQNKLLERHNKELGNLVEERTKQLKSEKEKSDMLLLNILPEEIAAELKEKGHSDAKQYEEVTVLFTDIKEFTYFAEKMSAHDLVKELNECFSAFDHILDKHNIEKIKTVGDAYIAVSGLPLANANHAQDMVHAALEIREYMEDRERQNPGSFQVRIGMDSGHVVAGIVGIRKFAYDIWGDTVNIAARMEQSGEPGKINISQKTYDLVKDKFTCSYRGEIEAKNKGKLKMYFVNT